MTASLERRLEYLEKATFTAGASQLPTVLPDTATDDELTVQARNGNPAYRWSESVEFFW